VFSALHTVNATLGAARRGACRRGCSPYGAVNSRTSPAQVRRGRARFFQCTQPRNASLRPVTNVSLQQGASNVARAPESQHHPVADSTALAAGTDAANAPSSLACLPRQTRRRRVGGCQCALSAPLEDTGDGRSARSPRSPRPLCSILRAPVGCCSPHRGL